MPCVMTDTDNQGSAKLARGLIWGVPLSIALWGALALALVAVTPPTVRHGIHAEARHAAHVLKSDLDGRTRVTEATSPR